MFKRQPSEQPAARHDEPKELSLWVRKSGTPVDAALHFTMPLDATVSDLLLKAFEAMAPPGSHDRPQMMELARNSVGLSNLQNITAALPSPAYLPGGSPDVENVLELRRRFQRGRSRAARQMPQADASPAANTPRPVSSSRRASDSGSAVATPTPEAATATPPANAANDDASPRPHSARVVASADVCVFQPQWQSPLCGTCGTHRRYHATFPTDRVELQDRIVRSHRRSRSRSQGRSHTPLWSPSSRHKSPSKVKPPCNKFRPMWSHETLCAECQHLEKEHPRSPRRRSPAMTGRSTPRRIFPDEVPAYMTPTVAAMGKMRGGSPPNLQRGSDIADHFRTPSPPKKDDATAAGKDVQVVKLHDHADCGEDDDDAATFRRRVCRNFAPLWNHNDHCAHCYNPLSMHPDVREKERRRLARAPRSGSSYQHVTATSHLEAARFCALPWHYILTFCAAEDLLVTARVCRLLTLAARPLLRSTMAIVLAHETPPEFGTMLESCAVQVAEQLAPGRTPCGDALLRASMGYTGVPDTIVSYIQLADRITLLRRVSRVVKPPSSERYVSHVRDAEQLHHALGRQMPEVAEAVMPLLHVLRSAVVRSHVMACASRYLAREQIVL